MLMTDYQLDTLKEIINIGIGKSASVLHKVTGKKVKLHIPEIKELVDLSDIEKEFNDHNIQSYSSVNMQFNGEFSGDAQLVFSSEDANRLVSLFVDDEIQSLDLDNILKASLTEIGNIVLNALMGTIANIIKVRIAYTFPNYTNQENMAMFYISKLDHNVIFYAKAQFTISEVNIDGNFILFLEVQSINKFLELIERSYLH